MRSTLQRILIVGMLAGFCGAQAVPAPGDAAAQTPANTPASSSAIPPGTIIPAELAKSVDARKVKMGDEFVARISQDMLSLGQVVLPRGSKIIGHITSAKGRDKGDTQSQLGLAFDKIVLKDREIPLNASIQALGAPMDYQSTNAMSEAQNGPPSGSSGYPGAPGGMTQPGTPPSPSSAGNMGNYPNANSNPPSASASHGPVPTNAQGVQGISDLSLSSGPQGSVVTSEKRNVKLDGGTQLLLRVSGA